jgi:hypothetical protein
VVTLYNIDVMPPDDVLHKTHEELERERLRLQKEINSYPTPIPGCDVYFNDLLERRSRICEELNRLGSVRADAAC